jgi:hypothetical protein
MRRISTGAAVDINAPASAVFEHACGSDAPAIVKAHGALPGVLKVDAHQGSWSAVGQKRLLRLSDGTSVLEELTEFVAGRRFAYVASGFTGPFGALVSAGRGEWAVEEIAPRKSRLRWTYEFTPRGALSAAAVAFIVHLLWPGYIRAALARIKARAEFPTKNA